ncbi:carboxylesterase [Hypoxylon rubiginosum]|uniref:Carboxylesterase n=1 Tax=Hypoxylon rubiginosum TaxID=110542 RepID=A0ACB9YWX6_9PEZI|nr:carboxylesterase [Hypoxylon rubiginosum]
MLISFFIATALASSILAQDVPAPVVDLGYERYEGFYNAASNQNIYRGIRYAAPPTGKLRWQLPEAPAENQSHVITAVNYPPQCPQLDDSPGLPSDPPSGGEDCLFLNVEAPANRTKLPVMVWIHGGGYGAGNNSLFPFSEQIKTNGNSFIAVAIQYRLGVFGFLSSAEVAEKGVLNVGIHDMRFALQWVQEHIHLFGGDPTQVTIAGSSAGAGAVMLLAMANGGTEGDSLFKGAIPASPYLPTQWDFDSERPTRYYDAFAEQVGCASNTSKSIFDCLVSADTVVLQNANAWVTALAGYGQRAFLPVTDGSLIRERPSQQLHYQGNVNGIRVLTGNTGNEGVVFLPQNITSEAAFRDFVLSNYPHLSDQNMTNLLNLYAVPSNSSGVYADSNGLTPPFSTTNSNWAIGWQQAANNLYAETTLACPSYWLADAYAKGDKCEGSWKYQFSVPPSLHSMDVYPLITDPSVQGTGMNEVFRTAFQRTWGNFIVKGDPTLSAAETESSGDDVWAAGTGNWPQWGETVGRYSMLNLNMTGGMPVTQSMSIGGADIEATIYVESTNGTWPPLEAIFQVVDAWSWEGGRGKRCQLWAELGSWAME